MLEPFTQLRAPAMVLNIDNIDTDQIIPARFLTTTSSEGLGEHLFADWREKGPFASLLADPRLPSARILIAGDNFGCGSSREHAPWAVLDFGIRAVISSKIADIFRGNALKNGLLPIEVDPEVLTELQHHPWQELKIDLEACVLTPAQGVATPFAVEPFARQCLLAGTDQLGWILQQEAAIEKFEAERACDRE